MRLFPYTTRKHAQWRINMPPKSDDVCDDTSTAAGSRFGKEMDGFFCLRVVNKVASSSYYYRFWGICKSNMYTAEAFFFFFFFFSRKERRGATSTPRRGVVVRVLCCQSCCRFLTRKATRPREWYSKGFLFHRKRNPKLDDKP